MTNAIILFCNYSTHFMDNLAQTYSSQWTVLKPLYHLT